MCTEAMPFAGGHGVSHLFQASQGKKRYESGRRIKGKNAMFPASEAIVIQRHRNECSEMVV